MVEKRPFLQIAAHLALILGVIVTAFPIWVALVASTHDATALSKNPIPLWFGDRFWENYGEVLGEGVGQAGGVSVAHMMTNSLIMAVGIAVGKIVISFTAAFAIVFFRFPFRMFAFWMIFMTLMLPVEVRILPTFDIAARLDLLDSYPGLILPLIASATATFLFRQFFLTIPEEMVEAARIDGAGPLRFLRDFLLPLSRTNMAALFIILFIYGWNQYLWPLLITNSTDYYTLMIGVKRMANAGEQLPVWHLIMATVTLAMTPPVLIVFFFQRMFVKGLVETEK